MILIRFLIPALLLGIILVLAKRYVESAPADERRARKITLALGVFALAVIVLTLLHRMHWIAAAIAVLVVALRIIATSRH